MGRLCATQSAACPPSHHPRCRSAWHVYPAMTIQEVAGHYDTAKRMVHCGPYRVCRAHPSKIQCRKCGAGAATTRVWYDDPAVNAYWLRCSANSYPYRITTA